MTGFTYTKVFATANDDYTVTLNYLDSATANGTDPMGNAITGYQWWNFAYPTVVTSGANAISEFIAATDDSVNFGGTVGAVPSRGVSFSIWNDPGQCEWLVGGSNHSDALDTAPRLCRQRIGQQRLHHDHTRWRQCGHDGCQCYLG